MRPARERVPLVDHARPFLRVERRTRHVGEPGEELYTSDLVGREYADGRSSGNTAAICHHCFPSASQIVDLAPGSFGSARSAHGGARRRPAPGCRTGRCSTTCNPGGMSFTLAQRGVDGIDHFPVGSHDHRGKAHSTCLVTALPYQLSEPEPERLRRAISSTIRSRMRFSHPSSLGAKNFSPASSGGRHVMSTTFSSVSCA